MPPATCLFAGGLREQETRDCKGIKISLGMSLQRGPLTLTRGLLESETEQCELSAEFVFVVPVSSTLGFLSLPLHLGFLHVQLPQRELSLSWASVLGLRLARAKPRLFQLS